MTGSVAIVGGGPAGSYAGYVIKKMNPELEVDIYDARRVIGKPVNCAGGIVTFWLERLGLRLPDHVVRQKIKALRIVAPNGEEWEHHQDTIGEDREIGFVMDRQGFDQWLLDRAKKAGVEVHLGSNPQHWEKPYHFEGAEYLLGCDGWKSNLGGHFGFETEVSDQDMHVGYEHRVIAPDYDQDFITFYMSERWSPEGYVWVFPEGGNVVKVGLGIPRSYKRDDHPRRVAVLSYLKNFLEDYPEFDGERVDRIASGAGYIPTSPPIKQFVKEVNGYQIGLIGDAARQVDPLHGGGIATAMLASRIAGTVIAQGDHLKKYQTQWDRKWKPEHMRRYAMKTALTDWGDKELIKMVRALGSFKMLTSDAPVEAGRMILHVLKKEPRMFTTTLMKTLLTYRGVHI